MSSLQQYKEFSFCTFSESVLPRRLHLIDTLTKYQAGLFEIEKAELFEELVKKVIKGDKTRYNLSSEAIRKLFGFTTYQKCQLYLDLIFYEAGIRLSEESASHSMKQLAHFEEYMECGFFLGYTMPISRTASLIQKIRSQDIIRNTRSLYGNRDEIYRLCTEVITPRLSDEEIIDTISPYNDGSYVDLPDEIRCLSYILLNEERYEQWGNLLNRLKFYPLQGAILYNIKTWRQFKAVLEQVKKPQFVHRKVVLYLLRERLFKILCEQRENLVRNTNNEHIAKKNQVDCKKLLDDFSSDVQSSLPEIISYFVNSLSLSDCSEWFSRKKAQYSNHDSKFIENELHALIIIEPILRALSKPAKWDIKSADFSTLIFYFKQTHDFNITQSRSRQLIEAFLKIVYGKGYFPNIRCEKDLFGVLRLIYSNLLNSGLDGISLLELNKKNFEGYGRDLEGANYSVRGDSIWLSVLLLGAGEHDDSELFSKVIGRLFLRMEQTHYSMDDFLLPLHIAELVVLQVMTEKKDWFESRLITNHPYLEYVIRALIPNKGKMSADNILSLQKRISHEWDIEEKLMIQKKVSNLEELKKYIANVSDKKHSNISYDN